MKQTLPSVPLITCDPYFSVWSPANNLTDVATCNWTGAPKPMNGTITIDGKEYRFMGVGSATAIEQTGLEITPTATRYTFITAEIQLDVTFRTPLLLTDLDLVSRPVSYISFNVTPLDRREHSVNIMLTVDEGHCYDGDTSKPMIGGVHHCNGFDAAWMGQRKQTPLGHSGDDVTIDWGYIYLAVQTGGSVQYHSSDRHTIVATVDMCVTATELGSALVAVAYDDIASIQYFGDSCKGYWARDGKTILEAIGEALDEYKVLTSRCNTFDEAMIEEAVNAGGESYAKICAAAYRQSIAAHKLIADREGNVIFVSKECYSNGCAVTVDVSYPSVPLYLLYQPELVKGMLRPVFKYAKLPVWEYDFAPHDVGRYPYVWGQVYALKERIGNSEVNPANYSYPAGSDIFNLRDQMPVEECGNMLIMTAAVALADGDVKFVAEQMPLLDKWVGYLLQYGADPGDQLCTDDFAGHLAHNVNLAAKAVMGIEAYSILLELLERDTEAAHYHAKAVTMAADWEKRASAGDHTMLCFGESSGWSLKYNLIWDRLFQSGLFQEDTYKREIECYLARANDYGVPLDSRKDYTKSDWIIWAAAFSDDAGVVEQFAKPLARFLENAPVRTPFSDWFDTKTAMQQGFQNRTVQGGLFMPLLRKKWVMGQDEIL
ncbi:MAG: DUF4965 domain-containing protein [Angelakisella sp.]